jgi:hypothetical protein
MYALSRGIFSWCSSYMVSYSYKYPRLKNGINLLKFSNDTWWFFMYATWFDTYPIILSMVKFVLNSQKMYDDLVVCYISNYTYFTCFPYGVVLIQLLSPTRIGIKFSKRHWWPRRMLYFEILLLQVFLNGVVLIQLYSTTYLYQ